MDVSALRRRVRPLADTPAHAYCTDMSGARHRDRGELRVRQEAHGAWRPSTSSSASEAARGGFTPGADLSRRARPVPPCPTPARPVPGTVTEASTNAGRIATAHLGAP